MCSDVLQALLQIRSLTHVWFAFLDVLVAPGMAVPICQLVSWSLGRPLWCRSVKNECNFTHSAQFGNII